MERKRRSGFRRIFTVTQTLAASGGSNPAGPILRFLSMIQYYLYKLNLNIPIVELYVEQSQV